MSPAEIAQAVRARLAAELADDLAALDRLAASVNKLRAPTASEDAEWMRARALAFEVERYYTAVEATLVRILRTLDGDVPGGDRWHQEVLRASSVAVAGLRPALLERASADELRELLKFRHLARHGYDTEPVLERMMEHAARVVRAHEGLGRSLRALDAWLGEEGPAG